MDKNLRLDQMVMEYSQLPMFFRDLARFAESFRQQKRQLRDQLEAADHSSWYVADAMGAGCRFFSNPDPGVLVMYRKGM